MGYGGQLGTGRQLTDEQLRHIATPSLLLLGQQSRLLAPQAVTRRATSLMPNITVKVVPGAGHGVLYQEPTAVSTHVHDFLTARES